MSVVKKYLNNVAKGIVNAAKSYTNMNDGTQDDATPDFVVAMLDTYINILNSYQQNSVTNKINYGKYINQIEKLRDKFIEKYDLGTSFVQTAALETDSDLIFAADNAIGYLYPTDGSDALPAAEVPELTLVGVAAE